MKKVLPLIFCLFLALSVFSDIKYALPEQKKNDLVLTHSYYTICYSKEHMDPLWCAEELDYGMTQGSATRPSKFKKDPLLPESFGHDEYTNSGFDRGHQVPAADMKFDQAAMNETFYTTNICPQFPQLNQQDWEHLEELARTWTYEYPSLYIVTGPVIESGKEHKTIGKSVSITVPDKYFKVIMVYDTKNPDSAKGIGFIMKNEQPVKGTALDSYAVPISEVEKATGLKFFASVPTAKRTEIVNKLDKTSWNWGDQNQAQQQKAKGAYDLLDQ